MTAFEHRGIVEGYYGKTYTPEDRLSWVRDIGQWGMNRYLYAPKSYGSTGDATSVRLSVFLYPRHI